MVARFPSFTRAKVISDGYTEQREANRIEFKPETGRPVRRRRTSTADVLIPVKLEWLTSDEWDQLDYFYHKALADGVLPFLWVHPRTKAAATFTFEGDPPKIVDIAGKKFCIGFTLRLIAG